MPRITLIDCYNQLLHATQDHQSGLILKAIISTTNKANRCSTALFTGRFKM